MAELDPSKVEAILQDYSETLEVLTINSKPLINDLTMAADRYKPLASQIVSRIESRLFEVPTNQKLPLLYLLDSIMKNLRRRYQDVINTKIVAIFCHCFEKLTEPKIRISLYKLRQTWNPFIVKKKLAAIDKHVHALDPNWPVTATDVVAPTSPTIHVNPEFLLTGDRGVSKPSSSAVTTSQNSVTVTVTVTRATASSGRKSSATQRAPPPSATSSSSSSSSALEQRRKNVLEAQKKKKEQLKAKSAGTDDPTPSTAQGNTAPSAPLHKDPRRVVVATSAVARSKKSSLSPRRSSRSSLSPEYSSVSAKRRKLSPRARPRSVSPSLSRHPPRHPLRHVRTHPDPRQHADQGKGAAREGEKEGGGGIGDILKSLDISSLMGSIQKVKEQTKEKNSSTAGKSTAGKSTAGKSTAGKSTAEKSTAEKSTAEKSTAEKSTAEKSTAEKSTADKSTAGSSSTSTAGGDRTTPEEDDQVAKPPPEKKFKLDDTTSTSLVSEEVGVADAAEEDDVIPKIKSSHLNLDDIPMELLPTHQEKIMKQVEKQLKSGRLSEEQHSILVKQLDQLYALQRKKENGREPRDDGGEREEVPGEGGLGVEGQRLSLSPPPSSSSSPPPPPPPAASGDRPHQTAHDSVKSSCATTNHLPPSPSPPSPPPLSPPPHVSVPPHVVSDSDIRPPLSPPLHPSHPPPPPDPHIDRHPPQSRGPHEFSRRPPRPFPPDRHSGPPRGPRPRRGGGPRDQRPFNRPPWPPGRPNSEWYGPKETPPASINTLPPTQGSASVSDPTQLFTKLLEHGIIKNEGGDRGVGPQEAAAVGVAPPQRAGHPSQPPPIRLHIPKLAFTVATLKKPYSVLVRLLYDYSGDPCATCGLRFRDRKTADYSDHLDWHYKMNSRDKTLQRPRNWYLHPEDWLKFEESKTGEESREPLVLEREVEGAREEGGEGETGQEGGQETSCEMLPGEEAEVCTICAEEFEKFWEEELEEWHFREAVREEGKLYHTYCYQDAKESGVLDRSVQPASPADVEQKSLAIA